MEQDKLKSMSIDTLRLNTKSGDLNIVAEEAYELGTEIVDPTMKFVIAQY